MSTNSTQPAASGLAAMASGASFPEVTPDLPVAIVLAVLYFLSATQMIRRLRQSRSKFVLQGLLVGLCMSRVVTFSLRAAAAANPTNTTLRIVATILVSAGALLLALVSMQLLIRYTKARRPELQQSKLFIGMTTAAQVTLIPMLIMTVSAGVQLFT